MSIRKRLNQARRTLILNEQLRKTERNRASGNRSTSFGATYEEMEQEILDAELQGARTKIWQDLKWMRNESTVQAPIRSQKLPIDLSNPHNSGKVKHYYEPLTWDVRDTEGFKQLVAGIVVDLLYPFNDLDLNKEGLFSDIQSFMIQMQEIAGHGNPSHRIVYWEQAPWLKNKDKLFSSLYGSIKNTQPLDMKYRPFEKEPEDKTVFPVALKEYANRWYLVGHELETKKSSWIAKPYVYPIDRIVQFEERFEGLPASPVATNWQNAFEDIIGVTLIDNAKFSEIRFAISDRRSNYLATKKMHHSQKGPFPSDLTGFKEFTIQVKPNPELYQTLYSFGPDIIVLSPAEVKRTFYEGIRACMDCA